VRLNGKGEPPRPGARFTERPTAPHGLQSTAPHLISGLWLAGPSAKTRAKVASTLPGIPCVRAGDLTCTLYLRRTGAVFGCRKQLPPCAFPSSSPVMDFLKSAVVSAIAKTSSVPYSFDAKIDIDQSIWTLHNSTKKVPSEDARAELHCPTHKPDRKTAPSAVCSPST